MADIVKHLDNQDAVGVRFIRSFPPNVHRSLVPELARIIATSPVREPVTLTNGTVVVHQRQPNGSTKAFVKDDTRALTGEEWAEYVAIVGFSV